MKTLLKNGQIVNVFTDKLEKANVLLEGQKIIGVGDYYDDSDADVVEDVTGKIICPGFVDGHIHIESSNLLPAELAKICVKHGTSAIVADPHEIANVCGVKGIEFMLQASEGLPMTVYVMLPSCVPATPHDEAGANLSAEDLRPLYNHPRVLGLAEMMNYPGLLFGDQPTIQKCEEAIALRKVINGHAPLLSGKDLDKYISFGINDDHESTQLGEALEKLNKGQWVMIRQGTCARNLDALMPLFEEPYNRRCLMVCDDKQSADLESAGHIDSIIRQAIAKGADPIKCIRMATFNAAACYNYRYHGAIAPGYYANVLVLDDLEQVTVRDVYHHGEKVVTNGVVKEFAEPKVDQTLWDAVYNSFNVKELTAQDFYIRPQSKKARIIQVTPYQVVTSELIAELNFDVNNGIDTQRDILKLAVVERHKNTGHIGLGYINGLMIQKGAIASSISHDSHNIICVGTNDEDMAAAVNHIRNIKGGTCIVIDGEVKADMPLPVAGLMTDAPKDVIIQQNHNLREWASKVGIPTRNDRAWLYIEPFMSMYFVSLSVIPSIKMLTTGLIDVNKQELIPLFVD